MVLEINGKAPLTKAFQKELAGRIGEWESRRDSHNGGWGPTAMVKALAAYGVPGYEVRAYETRQDAWPTPRGPSRRSTRPCSCWPGAAPTPG